MARQTQRTNHVAIAVAVSVFGASLFGVAQPLDRAEAAAATSKSCSAQQLAVSKQLKLKPTTKPSTAYISHHRLLEVSVSYKGRAVEVPQVDRGESHICMVSHHSTSTSAEAVFLTLSKGRVVFSSSEKVKGNREDLEFEGKASIR